jgi:hypothetical protein
MSEASPSWADRERERERTEEWDGGFPEDWQQEMTDGKIGDLYTSLPFDKVGCS